MAIFDSNIPGVLDFGTKGRTRTVALINWGDSPRTMSVDNGSAFVWEFWDKTFRIHNGGACSVEIAPHSSVVLHFTPLDSTAVIGSDACIVMQSPWRKEENAISGTCTKLQETLYVASCRTLTAADGCVVSAIATDGDYTVYSVTAENGNYTLYE